MTFLLLCDSGWCVHKSDVQKDKWDDKKKRSKERASRESSVLNCACVVIMIKSNYTLNNFSRSREWECILDRTCILGTSPQCDVEKLHRNSVEAHTLPIRAVCSVKEQSWNILFNSPASVV